MTVEALSMLERVGGLDLVRAVTGAFLRTAPVRLADARAGLARGEARVVANAVHALKSSCLQLGASELGGVCETAETAAEAGRLDGMAATLDRIEQDLETLHGELQVALDRIAAAPRRLVAVVEDNPDNRLLLHAILASRYELIECATGEEAIAELPKRVPGVILMDISLPGGDDGKCADVHRGVGDEPVATNLRNESAQPGPEIDSL